MALEKKCGWCKKLLPLTSFTKDKAYRDGLFGHCRSCDKAKQDFARYPDGHSVTRKRGRQVTSQMAMDRLNARRHKDRQSAYDSLICPEHFTIRVARREGPRMRMRCRECRKAIKITAAAKAGHKAWRLSPNGRAVKRLDRKARRMRERGGGPMRAADIRRLFATYPACLACAATVNLTIEHIVPLARGGTNAFSNLQVLCMPCNNEKGVTTIDYRPRVSDAV